MLTNLSPEVIDFLWTLKKSSKGVFVDSTIIANEFEKYNPKIKGFFKSRKIPSKKISINKLVENSYVEAFDRNSPIVELSHIFLSFLSFLDKDLYQSGSAALVEIYTSRAEAREAVVRQFIFDLTELAELDLLPPLAERKDLIEEILRKLIMSKKSNLVLIGPQGVGKTYLAYNLAQRIVHWKVPKSLAGARIFLVDVSGMALANLDLRIYLEKAINMAMEKTLKTGRKAIFFFDNLNMLPFGASIGFSVKSGGAPISFLGAARSFDGARFLDTPIGELWEEFEVTPPDKSELGKIVSLKSKLLEKHYNASFSKDALEAICSLPLSKVNPQMAMPGLAVYVLDSVCAKKIVEQDSFDSVSSKESEQLLSLKRSLRDALLARNLDLAGELDTKISLLEKNFLKKSGGKSVKIKISKKDVERFLQKEKGSEGMEKEVDFSKVGENIYKNIIGQDEAVANLILSLKRSYLKLNSPKRPVGSFLFLGASGVGKTQTAKVLARSFFGGEKNFVRIDMSDFRERHTVSRLVGAPPGYVGFEEGGQLTEFIKNNPKSVVLFDEIEKAHPDVLNILLQVMEEGEIVDAGGEAFSFRDAIVILTGNIGSDLIAKGGMGFSSSQMSSAPDGVGYAILKERVLSEAKKVLKPEFLNRLDSTVVFRSLSKEDLFKIFDLILEEYRQNLKERGIKLEVAEEVKKSLVEKSFVSEYGARPLRRAIEREIIDQVAETLLKTPKFHGTLNADMEDGKILVASL